MLPETSLRPQEDRLLRDPEVLARLERSLEPKDSRAVAVAESFVHLLKTYNVAMERFSHQLPEGMTPARYNLLVVLKLASERRLPMSEIGSRMSVTCANITKLVDGLEREGLVRRVGNPEDRRSVMAELTEAGYARIATLLPRQHAALRELWSDMTEEDCRLLTHLLIKLRCSVETERE